MAHVAEQTVAQRLGSRSEASRPAWPLGLFPEHEAFEGEASDRTISSMNYMANWSMTRQLDGP